MEFKIGQSSQFCVCIHT